MLYESPLSLAAIGIAAALIVPECTAILDQPDKIPSMTLVVGAIIGAFGVYALTAVASSHEKLAVRLSLVTIWGGLALGLSVGVGICAPGGPELWRKIALLGAASAPILAFTVSLIQILREKQLFSK